MAVQSFVFAILLTYMFWRVNVFYRKQRYRGFRRYRLLVDSELKYVIGLFMLSLLVNLYLNPLPGVLNYTIVTVLIALAGSARIFREKIRFS